MPWTESRSREEWLAEVTRRGERLRRRRRVLASTAGAVAVLVPAFAFASMSSGGHDRQLQVAASGPVPTTGAVALPPPSIFDGDLAIPTTTTLVADVAETVPPAAAVVATTTTALRPRPTRVSDDPVVSATSAPPTTAARSDSVQSSPLLPLPASTTVPSPEPSPSTCPTADVKVTVTLEKSTYTAGETVRWSSTLENRSSTTCLVSGRAFFHVENADGKVVGSFPYTANFMLPVKAEPGKTITNTGSWDQRDCSGSECVQVPSGMYVVVAEWTEAAPYTGRGSFQVAA